MHKKRTNLIIIITEISSTKKELGHSHNMIYKIILKQYKEISMEITKLILTKENLVYSHKIEVNKSILKINNNNL